MIRLTRERAAREIPASLRGAKRRAKELELLKLWRDHVAAGASESPPWKTTYWKAGKKSLKKHSIGKCAYCESPTDVVAHGDVEHFRPKSVYWWLAYCFDNHLFACQICNQSYKGDNFPVNGPRLTGPTIDAATSDAQLDAFVDMFAPDPLDVTLGYSLTTFNTQCLGEQAGLPDPYNEDPEPYFRWEADTTNKEVWLRPNSNSVRHKFIVDSCEQFFGINREELRRWRWILAYEHLAVLQTILADLDQQGVTGVARQTTIDAIRDMMESNQPYAGMVRYFVKVKWVLPI